MTNNKVIKEYNVKSFLYSLPGYYWTMVILLIAQIVFCIYTFNLRKEEFSVQIYALILFNIIYSIYVYRYLYLVVFCKIRIILYDDYLVRVGTFFNSKKLLIYKHNKIDKTNVRESRTPFKEDNKELHISYTDGKSFVIDELTLGSENFSELSQLVNNITKSWN